MIISNNCEVDFGRYNSINSLHGFDGKHYSSGFHESENRVNILTTKSILTYKLVNIDIISSSYVNGCTQSTIYSFSPDVSLGYKIIEKPHNLLYLQITSDVIHSMTIWLTDQNGNELNLRGENLSMRFHLREIKVNILSF